MSTFSSVISPIVRSGLAWLSRQRLPQVSGTLHVTGLQAPVEVMRDRWGIPHLYASTPQDLFFAQGFVHAQDRLWQMELHRRTAQGHLSELFGELALDTDRTARTFGFSRLGRADWNIATQQVRDAILAYSAGVNAFLEHPSGKLPVEFTLLRYKPEPWQPEDTMAFSRVMLWQLSHAWYGEIVRAQLIEAVGEGHAAELDIQYPDANPTTLPDGIEFRRLDPTDVLHRMNGPFLDRGKGSNAWSVSPSKSASGNAALCNDMHLSLSMPGLWYANHLHAGEFHVTGVSVPGMPMILVGHNERIAWGMTLAFTDCEDLFVEQVDPQAPHRYRFRDEWLEADVIEESIVVKGRTEPHVERIVVTHHGPIISDVVDYPDQRIAVNSMSLRPCPAFSGWLQLNQAGGWDEFVEAMRLIEAPQLNVTYADVEGNIGYWVTGKVPVRARGDGTVPAPGWTGEHEWLDEVPFEEMPHALNPEQGYVVSCNHRIMSDDYPHFLGNVWMNGYRARRIVEVFDGQDRLSPEDFRALQLDVTCLPGQEFVARLRDFTSSDPDVQLALEQLTAWNGRLTPESIGGTLYEVARYILVRNLLDPGLGPDLTVRFMGHGFHPLLFASSEFSGHDTVALIRLLDDPNSWWLQQAGGREALLSRSLKQAVLWLRDELGPDLHDWQWGRIHGAIFAHALGLQKPLDQAFDRGPYPIGGDTDTPCQTAISPKDPYHNKAWAPSYRQIVDMGDLSRSEAIHPPGQSGHLASSHYDDLVEPWLRGDYYPMLWTREQVEQEAQDQLLLVGQD